MCAWMCVCVCWRVLGVGVCVHDHVYTHTNIHACIYISMDVYEHIHYIHVNIHKEI